jgi:DNA-binding transcriptional LysR family regulator
MTDQQSTIFRPEALEHRDRQQTAGSVVRLAPRWTTGAFYALVILFLAGVVAASVIEIDRFATGTTAVEGGRVVVLLPASLAPDVSAGNRVELGAEVAQVDSFGNEVLYPPDVRARYGVEVAVPSVAVVTTAAAAGTPVETARVLVESDPVLVALIPGLEAIFGGG